jgi:hypothetical protein
MKKIFIFITSFFFFLCSVQLVRADENFDVQLSSIYNVTTNGNTSVQQKFQITNRKPTVYAKQYALEVGATKLQNVRAFDNNGTIPTQVVNTANKTSIALTFNDDIVGEGKSRNFTIQFDNPDTAIISGSVLEVYIPRLSNVQDYSNYSVTLHTPALFGTPARISPHNYTLQQENGGVSLHFSSLHGESISALFGKKQIFDYTLRYNLQNPTGNTGVIQVALPPDTEYQKVVYASLEPEPKEMSRDVDGNWIATYQIDAQQSLEVYLTGKAYIYLEPQKNMFVPEPRPSFVEAQKYWEVGNGQIKDLAQKFKTPKEIYDYTATHLTYNYAKLEGNVDRLGAVAALAQPKNAACQEFTDVFIAVARAANIPARRNTGFAYTANSRLRPLSLVEDILHAWPEYYDKDKKSWIPIDPTWGNTTGGINYFDQFDFNHFVFAINGSSSETPYSAGAYKKEHQTSKDVEVKFGKAEPFPDLQLRVKLNNDPQLKLSWPLKQRYTFSITNLTGSAFYNLPLHFATNNEKIRVTSAPAQLEYLLPFQTREISVETQSEQIFHPDSFRLTAQVGSLSSTYDLQSGLTIENLKRIFPAVSVVGCMVIVTLITWRLLVHRRKR